MYDFDHDLFLALNFDGGETIDRLMLTISDTPMWIPLYMLILWMVWRKDGVKALVIFILLLAAALGLSDIIAGVFKANGLCGELLEGFSPRWRPMFTPELEGLDITPDSLCKLRQLPLALQEAAGWTALPPKVHVPLEAVSGHYGTVSAHASTVVALAVLSMGVIRRRWFGWLMVVSCVVICYSRIYLGKHFPMDLVWGTLVGIGVGAAALWCYRRLRDRVCGTK